MPSVESIYPDFLNAVGFASGKGADFSRWNVDELALMDRMVQWGYRGALYPTIAPGQRRAYRWNHLFPTATLELLTAASGTLDRVPDRLGTTLILTANTEVFTSAMEGVRVRFTATEDEYEIVNYISASRVEVRGIGDAEFGKRIVAKTTRLQSTIISTSITSTDAAYTADMVGDIYRDTSTDNTYAITLADSTTVLRLEGDASAESGAHTIERAATVAAAITVAGGASTISVTSPPVFREAMVGDTITFDTSSNSYTIAGFTDSSTVTVTGDATGETALDGITIKTSVTDATSGSALVEATMTADRDIFSDASVGLYVASVDSPLALTIIEYLDERRVQVTGTLTTISAVVGKPPRGPGQPPPESGRGPRTVDLAQFYDVAVENANDFAVVQGLDFVTVASYTSPRTQLTVSGTPFTAAMVGMAVYEPVSGSAYTIVEFVNTAVVYISGDASQVIVPGGNNKIWILSRADQVAGDAFTILNTGGDYEMPADFPGTMDGYFTFAPQQSYTPIRIIGEGQIRKFRQGSTVARRPLYVAFVPIQSDNRKSQRFKAMFDSAPDQSYTLTYRYAVVPQKLTFDAPYPLGGPEFSELIMASCLAMVETHIEDVTGTMRRDEFRQKLAAAVTADEMAMTPEYLGYNANERRNLPGVSAAEWRRFSGVQVTIDEVQY